MLDLSGVNADELLFDHENVLSLQFLSSICQLKNEVVQNLFDELQTLTFLS